jgi:hypothetical protein
MNETARIIVDMSPDSTITIAMELVVVYSACQATCGREYGLFTERKLRQSRSKLSRTNIGIMSYSTRVFRDESVGVSAIGGKSRGDTGSVYLQVIYGLQA